MVSLAICGVHQPKRGISQALRGSKVDEKHKIRKSPYATTWWLILFLNFISTFFTFFPAPFIARDPGSGLVWRHYSPPPPFPFSLDQALLFSQPFDTSILSKQAVKKKQKKTAALIKALYCYLGTIISSQISRDGTPSDITWSSSYRPSAPLDIPPKKRVASAASERSDATAAAARRAVATVTDSSSTVPLLLLLVRTPDLLHVHRPRARYRP